MVTQEMSKAAVRGLNIIVVMTDTVTKTHCNPRSQWTTINGERTNYLTRVYSYRTDLQYQRFLAIHVYLFICLFIYLCSCFDYNLIAIQIQFTKEIGSNSQNHKHYSDSNI